MDGDREILPSRSFISARPTSRQLCGRRYTEFSLSAVIAPNGKISNKNLQLQWSEPKTIPSYFAGGGIGGGGGDGRLYDDLVITDHSSPTTKRGAQTTNSAVSSEWLRDSTIPSVYAPATSDIFASSFAISPSSTNSNGFHHRRSRSSSAPLSLADQLVLYVSVDLRIAFFQWPGLIVRKQVVKEVRNDLTILEVLQHLIKCAGIDLTPSMNCETARLFCLRETQNGLRFEEIDYLQWRCALLAEMSSSVSFQFVLDFTDTEDGTSTFASSSAHSICPIDMGFKQ